ncbi:MAG: CHAT domain-containing protein [Bacteroidota bacterium]
MKNAPVIILAFANDREGKFLRSIAEEQRTITQALNPLVKKKLLHLEILSNVRANDITEAFRTFGDRVKTLHYGGHANDLELLLGGTDSKLDIEAFSQFLQAQEGLELVFMNGCATAAQADPLKKAGIPNLILTEVIINDQAAQSFSTEFYKGLASGRPVSTSFQEAEGVTKGDIGKQRGDLVFSRESMEDVSDMPWTLHRQTTSSWTLPTKAPFPLIPVLAAVVVLLGLVFGGMNMWKYSIPFDVNVPVTYPEGVSDQHFDPLKHTLMVELSDQTQSKELGSEAQVQLTQVTGEKQPIPISLKSDIWELTDNTLRISRDPNRIQLKWKENLTRVKGQVRGDEGFLSDVTVTYEDTQAVTDAQGRFTLVIPEALIPTYVHKLSLIKEGYQPRNMTVNLADGKSTYDFFMETQTP